MVATIHAYVNDRRTSNIDRDGFDRDLSYDESAPRMRLMPAGTAADIDILSDTDTAAEGRTLVSRGNTFLPKKPNEVVNDNKPDEDSGTVEVHDHAPLTTTRGRYDLRHSIASMLRPDDGTRGPAVCGCGLSGHEIDDVAVHLNGNKRAYVSGVFRCDSAWLCPTCAPRRAFEIQERLTVAARACIERGGSVWFVTPTVRRIRDQPLLEMKNGFQAAWRQARQGARWAKSAKAAGILGLTNVVETPWSPVTGWGAHGHTLIFFDHRDADRAREACELLIHRFLGRLPDHGLSGTWYAQDAEECQDAKKAATYCGKVAAELAHGWVKKGRKLSSTSVHPFALAARATMQTPDGNQIDVPGLERVSLKRCKALWREYAAAMPGTRLGVISASLAKKLGIQPANDDDEDGVLEMLEEERIGTIPAPTWNRLVRRALAGTFLSKIEANVDPGDGYGWDEVKAWAMEAGTEDQPGDDEFLRSDGPLERREPLSPEAMAECHAATEVMLTRDIACRVRSAQALGKAHQFIAAEIDRHRENGHPVAALPTSMGIVKEIARLDREAVERDAALNALMAAA
jgi:hypothetical protein